MTQQPPIAEGLQQDMGASALPSGSCASHEAPAGLHPSGFDPSRETLTEHMRRTLDPYLFAVLQRNFEDADYNREYEQKGLSAWESPEYRPYCGGCSTMRRMEHRDYGYQCSVCGGICGPDGSAIAMEARQGGDGETRLHPKDDSAGPQDIAQPASGPSHD